MHRNANLTPGAAGSGNRIASRQNRQGSWSSLAGNCGSSVRIGNRFARAVVLMCCLVFIPFGVHHWPSSGIGAGFRP
jgi:hypothetical protein